jgi:endonuclease/exonuclease/phosphatase family metal-dependent hydrolase
MGTYRVLTYNCRGFFDRYDERKPLLHAAVRSARADVVALQEAMVNGAGLDTDMARGALGSTVAAPWTILQDASFITNIERFGAPPALPLAVALILRGIIVMMQIALRVPLLGSVVQKMPLALERLRERVGICAKRCCCGAFVDIYPLGHGSCVLLAPFFGLSTMIRPGLVAEAEEVLVLQPTGSREHMGTAIRTRVRDAQSGVALFWLVNLHLVSFTTPAGRSMRTREARRVLNWMDAVLHETDGRCVVVGDHNTLLRDEPLFGVFTTRGYVSAHRAVKGAEPASTWPTGIVAPFMDVDGAALHPEGVCLDFIWTIGEGLVAVDAGVVGAEHASDDATLYASDHVGVWAELRVG